MMPLHYMRLCLNAIWESLSGCQRGEGPILQGPRFLPRRVATHAEHTPTEYTYMHGC